MARYSPPLAYWYLRKRHRGQPVDLSTIGPGSYVPTPTPTGGNPPGTSPSEGSRSRARTFAFGLMGASRVTTRTL